MLAGAHGLRLLGELAYGVDLPGEVKHG
jgi:hypothetical protein